MGCINSFKSSQEENKIASVQSSWKLNNFESQTLLTALSLISTELIISDNQLIQVVLKLDIDPSLVTDFFYRFTKQGPCPLKKIKCLFIVLGQSSLKKKLKLFFKVYAETRLRLMVKSEAELMISHLIQILLLEIPEHCCSVYPDDNDLREYCSMICIFTNPLLKYFINKIIGKESDVSCSEIITRFENDKELRYLLKGRKLRRFCFDIFQRQTSINEKRFKEVAINKSSLRDETTSTELEVNLSIS